MNDAQSPPRAEGAAGTYRATGDGRRATEPQNPEPRTPSPESGGSSPPPDQAPDRALGLVAFLATVTMLFTALTAAYLIRRTGTDWGRVELPRILVAAAAVLVASSLALEAARRKNSRSLVRVSAGLGLVFLVLQVVAWRSLAAAGVYLPTSPHASFFYVLSALHGLHLAGGILVLSAASTGRIGVGPASVYWHYVGGLWFYLYFLLSFF